MTNENDFLTQLDGAFSAAPTEMPKQEFDRPPNGVYFAACEKVSIEANKSEPSKHHLLWQFRILAPRLVNRKLWKKSALTPKAMPYLKGELVIGGLDIERISDLPARKDQLVGRVFEVKVADDGDPKYYRVFVNRKLAASVDEWRAANPDAEMAAREQDDAAATGASAFGTDDPAAGAGAPAEIPF